MGRAREYSRSVVRCRRAWLYFTELNRGEVLEFLNSPEIDLLHWRSTIHPHSGPPWKRGPKGTGIYWPVRDLLRWLVARWKRGLKIRESPALEILRSGQPWPDGKKRKPRGVREVVPNITRALAEKRRARMIARGEAYIPPPPLPAQLLPPTAPIIPCLPFAPSMATAAASRGEEEDLFDWSDFSRRHSVIPHSAPPLRMPVADKRRIIPRRLPPKLKYVEPPPPLPPTHPMPDVLEPERVTVQPLLSLSSWDSLANGNGDPEALRRTPLVGLQPPTPSPMDGFHERQRPLPAVQPIRFKPKAKRKRRRQH